MPRALAGPEPAHDEARPALVTLSHDHHLALYVARTLTRATTETAGDGRAVFVECWDEHGREHFRLEEEIVLPAYARHGDPHRPLAAQALCDKVDIRARADAHARRDARPGHPARARAHLVDHVRLEERQLFALIEAALPTTRLATVATALEHAEGCAESAQGV